MRRGLALGREVGGQNHLFDFTLPGRQVFILRIARQHAVKQGLQSDVMRSHAIERAELAHQDVIQTLVRQRALKRGLVRRSFHHAEFAAVALRVLAGVTNVQLCQRVAQRAVFDAENCVLNGLGNLHRTGLVVLQQVKSHASRRLDADTGQTAQRLGQTVQGI